MNFFPREIALLLRSITQKFVEATEQSSEIFAPEPTSTRQGETALLKHKTNALSNGDARKLDQFIPERFVGFHQRLVGSDRFVEILLALAVLLEDFPPGGAIKTRRL